MNVEKIFQSKLFILLCGILLGFALFFVFYPVPIQSLSDQEQYSELVRQFGQRNLELAKNLEELGRTKDNLTEQVRGYEKELGKIRAIELGLRSTNRKLEESNREFRDKIDAITRAVGSIDGSISEQYDIIGTVQAISRKLREIVTLIED